MTRFFDFVFSFLGIIILSPLILLITLINIFETKFRPFFFQKRVGKNGVLFQLVKFRTMYSNPDNRIFVTVSNRDRRITKFGYFLRRYKLDEIPQLFNVILGDMSLVGPRPEVMEYVNFYSAEQMKTLNVRPGITDYASIEYFNENEMLSSAIDPEKTYIVEIMPKKIELNQKYISDHSLKHYFLILFLTIRRIFTS
jgi:lipopolysaccharide/colanic/teichoic acid biosynthesis glycosyltransferase